MGSSVRARTTVRICSISPSGKVLEIFMRVFLSNDSRLSRDCRLTNEQISVSIVAHIHIRFTRRRPLANNFLSHSFHNFLPTVSRPRVLSAPVGRPANVNNDNDIIAAKLPVKRRGARTLVVTDVASIFAHWHFHPPIIGLGIVHDVFESSGAEG
jgi:hypothetical protein